MQIAIIVAYIAIMLIVSLYYAKKEVTTNEDLVVAGQRLPLIVLISTLLATWVGSGTVIGGASFVYQYGPLASLFFFAGGPLGIIVLYFIAGKARELSKYTVPQLLELRFGKSTKNIAALFIVLAYIGIASYQFIGGGYILNVTIGLEAESGALIVAFIVIFLAMTGGMFSIAYTDLLSTILIIGGFVIAIPFVLSEVGGMDVLQGELPATQSLWNGGLSFTQLIGFFLPTFLLILGDQNMYQRFASANSVKTARLSTVGFFVGNIVIIGLAMFLATAAIVLFPAIEPDTAILQIAGNTVPLLVGSLMLAAATAFMITTANSYLLSSASNIVYDLYEAITGKELALKKQLLFTRITILLVGILAYFLGVYFPSVLEIQMYSYTMYGAALTPVILASFFWARATKAGAIGAILTGGGMTLIWEIVLDKPLGWNSVLVALPLAVLVLVVVSLFTQKTINQKEREQVHESFSNTNQ
ncbi:sodium:solute symporter family protein [Shouchella patagoniensis]|uniref:sodium:solute symporter family protein n=1 Tax=Shouchella patagoniensis TaxID=228576 RepID=UPI001FEC8E43|nr:sodium:solute symporter family protein [Shouchella patagoniensis]